MPAVAQRLRRAYPAPLGRAGVGSIPANPDALNVPSFRRWRFEMKLSPLLPEISMEPMCFARIQGCKSKCWFACIWTIAHFKLHWASSTSVPLLYSVEQAYFCSRRQANRTNGKRGFGFRRFKKSWRARATSRAKARCLDQNWQSLAFKAHRSDHWATTAYLR